MQGLITLDFGNSHPHAGLFQKINNHWQLIKTVPWSELPIYIDQLQFTPGNSSLVLSEVKKRDEELQPLLDKGFLLTTVKSNWKGTKFFGMPVQYAQTLGDDRLISSYYLFKKNKKPMLLIDAGTFVTIDVINESGFQGGYILPSQKNYFESFQKGEQLKDVSLEVLSTKSLPQETKTAMSGSYFAFVALVNSLLKEHRIQEIIVTGGNASWWMKELAQDTSGIHVKEEKDLIHLALHFWMTTQIEPT